MPQNESINNTEDYVNYTFHISSKGVGIVAGELVGLSNTVSNLLGDIAFKTSEILSSTEMLAIGTSVAVGAMFTSAIKDSIRFEQQMANVKAIGGESLNAQEIGNAAMEYSNKFGMATASMTEGLEALARAGITTTNVMASVLEEGVKLSKLEGMDLEDSINDLIATTNLLSSDNVNMNDAQYGDMVKQMNQHIVSTSESAPINAQNIIQSLQHVGGYASAGGIDQDDLFAVIAQLGSRGTKGEMAGTALRAFIAAGQKDTAQRALARIGLNVSDLWNDNGETMLSISEMKDVLDKALEARGYSKQEKLEFYSDFAGYKQANQIMKIDTSEVQQYKEQIANAWDLGKKLDTILGTVKGNLDRIWQIIQNFMTKVGGKILFIANAILTPVRILLELINKMPFADTAVAAGMIIVGFNGVLKIINNIVPRFSTFFIQLSKSKRDVLDIRNIWRELPNDITNAKDVLKAMSDPKKMMKIQQDRQLYSKKEVEVAENKVAKMQFIQANLEDPALSNLTTNAKKTYLGATWDKKDEGYKRNFINTLKIEDPKKYENMMKDYFERVVSDSNLSASRASYDMVEIMNNEETALWEINEYVGWIYRSMGGPTVNENEHNNNSPPPSSSHDTESNRQRNARVNERKTAFKDIGNNILIHRSEYGDYSYKVNPNINMPQFNYNDIEDMRRFEAQVRSEIKRKMDMYANFFEDSGIEAGRNRLKKSLTVSAKTDLGYEFSTGANTSDIKKILETGNIREGSSHILDEQLQTIADALGESVSGDKNRDMLHFARVLNSKNNKDELLESILNKTQKQWNDKYYNNGRVGFFPTKTLEEASGGATAQKIIEKMNLAGANVSSIAEVQEHFKNVALDDTLLNECVDIMYQDRELVEKLVNEEIKYMYENLVRVQNSILNASRERHDDSTFENKGEEYSAKVQKATDYVLAEFNPRDFANFTPSPFNDEIYSLSDAITYQNDEIIDSDKLEGYQHFIYPLGTDIAYFQRYGKDFPIRNIRFIPYNEILQRAIEDPFLDDDENGERYEFLEVFADWSKAASMIDKHYWDTTFDFTTVEDYFQYSGFDITLSTFEKLKQEFEDRYRTYVASVTSDAQSLIESQELYGPTLSFRAGSFFTPENEFGAFDTITSTSLVENNIIPFKKSGRSLLKIYNPEDNPGVIGHYNILNRYGEHLWAREHELTLPSNQPYFHMKNPDDEWKMLLTLTADQQQAVKEIMGEGFEFKKNAPFDPFLNAGEPDDGGSFDLFMRKHPNLHKNHKPLNISKYIDENVMEQMKKESQLKKKYIIENIGESPSTSNILRNKISLMLNKDNLTTENMGIKLQDLLENGAISVGGKYKGDSLGGSNSDDVISINTGSIKYHTDNYSDLYGDYGKELLNTVLHEMTHILMMHKERQNYKNNNIPSELGIDNFKTSQLIEGYNKNFVAEYEAQYVSSQVLNRLGIKANKKSQQRMAAFKDLIESKGYGDQIQYELLDTLVDEMLSNITVIGDITEGLSTQFDMASAGVTSMQVSEDMRPILSKIQAFNKNVKVYEGPADAKSKKDKIDQTLSDMEKDMESLWSSGIFDKELIYHMVGQKYLPYIETLENVSLGYFLKHASPKFKKITPNFIAKMSLDNDVDRHVKNFVVSDLSDVLEPIMKEEKEKDPNKKLRKTLSGFKEVWIEGKGVLRLPIHSAPPVTNASGKYDQGYMNKFIFNRAKDATTGPLGVRNILDSDPVQGLPMSQKVHIAKSILEEEQYKPASDLMSVDKKLSGAVGWFVINTDTGITCINRMTDGICEFADACYAAAGTIRPSGLKKQLAKMIMYYDNTPEELVNEIQERKGKVGRINQEGEFNSLEDFYKIKQIAELLPDVRFYGYTKNQDVLREIIKNGLPDNLTINDSLGHTHGAQYMSVPQGQIIDYLEAGYLLCKGACATCEQCLNDIKKVTILRDGSQTLGVEDVAHLNLKGQKVVFQTLKDYENAGVQVTRELTKEIIADVSAASEMVRQNQVTFSNEGEYRRLPELGDYYPFVDPRTGKTPRRDTKFIESLGYGGMDDNIMDFFNEVDETFLWEENELNRKKKRTDDHWGTRGVINFGYHDIGTQTARLLNYGLYYNRKPTREAKQTGIEEIVNLFNKDATKEAFMQEIISYNQLKKWHKQLQDSAAVDKYGEVPWGPKDIEEWKKEKDEAEQKLADLLQERKKKIVEALEMQNEVSVSVSNPKTKQATLDPFMTQTKAAEFGMPGLHFDTFGGFNIGKQQFDKNRNIKEEYIKQFYNAIDNDDINLLEESLSKLIMFDKEFAAYRTVLNRINNLDERKGLLQNNVKTLKSLLIPDIRNTNGTSIIGSGLFFDDNKLEAYKEKIKKENAYKKSIKKDIGEDTQQTINSQFVMTPEVRDFINNQKDASTVKIKSDKKSTIDPSLREKFENARKSAKEKVQAQREKTQEDTISMLNSQFVMTPEIRDFIDRQGVPNVATSLDINELFKNAQKSAKEKIEKQAKTASETTPETKEIPKWKVPIKMQLKFEEERNKREGEKYAAQKRQRTRSHYEEQKWIIHTKQRIKELQELRKAQKQIYKEEREKLKQQQEQQAELYDESRKKEKERLQEKWKKREKPKEKDDKKDKGFFENLRENIMLGTGSHAYYFGGEKKFASNKDQTEIQKKIQDILINGKNIGILNKKAHIPGLNDFERTHNNVKEKINNDYKKSVENMQETDVFSKSANKIEGVIQPLQEFTNALDSLSDIFPILTPAVMFLNKGLSIATTAIEVLNAIQAYNTAVTGANSTAKTLNTMAEEGNTAATYLNTVAKWAETGGEGTVKKAIGTIVNKGVNLLGKGLTTIGEMSVSTVAMIALPIIAIIAAIEAIKFWENKHAEALKESQKALEEATAKNNIAVSQYKDLKKARENETDAIRRQQAARKEAIALYELEASRIKKQKSIQEEAKLRNDAVWGEYGLRADLQKAGLGFIAGGDFESQYQNYEGTTSNIRQIKESQIGKVFKGTAEQEYVSQVYDKNSMFFAQVEGNKEPLQELYDKESKLIEKYGSIDNARASKEFYEAVKEFSDATGINGKTAGMMLDWLETENRVNQATQAMKTRVNIITAKADAKAMSADIDDEDLGDNNNLEQAMIMAQAQDIYKEAYDYMWWEKFQADLFGILWTIVDAVTFWDWTDNASKYWKKSEAYQAGIEELAALGVRGVADVGNEMAKNAKRKNYGAGKVGNYHDTPFGGALESLEAKNKDYAQSIKLERRYANDETRKFHADIRKGMIKAGEGGVEGFKIGLDQHSPGAISRSVDQEMKYTKESFEKNREPIKQLSYDIGYESGEQYGQGFIDGLKALYEQVSTPEALTKSLENKIIVEQGFKTPEGADPNDPAIQKMQSERRQKTYMRLGGQSVGTDSFILDFAKNKARDVAKDELKQTGRVLQGKARKPGGLHPDALLGRLYESAGIIKNEGIVAGGKNLFRPSNPAAASKGFTKGSKDVLKSLFSFGDDAAAKTTAKSIGVASKGGTTALKALGKGLEFLGPIITFGTSAVEHNPFEKHFNEDGTEKKAFQSTGEVMGATAGSVGAMAVGAVATAFTGPVGGAIAATLAGFVLEPLGEAIGGTIGWIGDTLFNGAKDMIGGAWDWVSGVATNTWDWISGAAGNTWDWLTGNNENDPYQNVNIQDNQMQQSTKQQSGNAIIIENININTEDDPEKIKSSLMNLIIEMQEQITPRTVSRTIGKPPSQSTSMTQNINDTPQAEGTDQQNTNNNNQNPTI